MLVNLKEFDVKLFQRIVEGTQKHNLLTNVLSNESSEVRKFVKILDGAGIALEQIEL
ncbi:MAG: hypothetical protein ACR2LL_05050 [Nitrosopumilus sp.]|uniref:hypothetical protein n=1 Tax=Nitrosopumilus sp. TaxID=2024843 RepID=UPI002930A3B7|nr:hypothetical protein [Nitrosopumilus sp.]